MKATREAYGEELAKLVQENKKIVGFGGGCPHAGKLYVGAGVR